MSDAYRSEEVHLKEIINRLAVTEGWPHNKIPCDYLVVDTETTGTNTSVDSIVQIGVCHVRDCKISHEFSEHDYSSFTIKLPRSAFVGKEGAIAVHGIDYEKSAREGIPPDKAYKLLCDIIVEARANGMMICGHNLYSFDIPILHAELARLGIPFKFAQNEVLDTAMLVKAMQIGIYPGVGEMSYSYWSRVRGFRAKGVYFNLDRYCVQRFNLEQYGASKEHAHDAGYDCWLAHLVVQELNKIVEG